MIFPVIVINTGPIFGAILSFFLSQSTQNMDNSTPLKQVSLQAREELFPPLGIVSQSPLNKGIASVFLRLENSQMQPTNIRIIDIKITNTSAQVIEGFASQCQTIDLKPLENSQIVIELFSQEGYGNNLEVQAVVIYQINGQKYQLTSSPSLVSKL